MPSLIKVTKRSNKLADVKLAKSIKSSSKMPPTIKGGISARISEIRAMVEKHLGQYKDKYIVIQDEQTLRDYIDACKKNKYISLDTETTGLDPLLNEIVGVCICTRGQKAAYIPLNHKSYITQQKVKDQLPMDVVRDIFIDLFSLVGLSCDMYNAKFDIRFMRDQLGVNNIFCTWDGYLAAKLMNENEPTHGLKPLHEKYVLNGVGDAWGYSSLFKGITFDYIPIQTAYLYAARDPEITMEYCDYQRQFLYYDSTETPEARNGMNGVAWVFFNIEMPCLPIVADMEDNGIAFDLDYASELSKIYNKRLKESLNSFYDKVSLYDKEIQAYKRKNPGNKLSDPISIGSPTQMAILLYDIMKMDIVDDRKPRGTGEDILLQMNDDSGIVKAILEYREVAKLVSTYIDKLPECVNPKDGRIHCSFNQYGAKTGRFSSDNPNLQNIPSKNHDIRKMFVATHNDEVISTNNDKFILKEWSEVETLNGFKYAGELKKGDKLKGQDGRDDLIVKAIILTGNEVTITV